MTKIQFKYQETIEREFNVAMSAEKTASSTKSTAASPSSSSAVNSKTTIKLPIYQSIPTHSAIETAIDDVEILETSFVVSFKNKLSDYFVWFELCFS